MIFIQTRLMGGEWIILAQDRNRLPAVVNTVMTVAVHKMLKISGLAAELKVKEAIPVQSPEGSRRFSLPDFKTIGI